MADCKDCEKYEKAGHNYCRMCGENFKKGTAKIARLSVAYYTNEKFCGGCGKTRQDCSC